MKTILISDTHFGVKQNSTTWMNSQIDFIYKELIPCIKHLQQTDNVQIIHCGDVFDSRSSINPFIASNVRTVFESLSKLCPIYIVTGNHDFYSPNDDVVSSLDFVLNSIPNVNIVKNTIECLLNEEDEVESILIPWYEFEKFEKLKKYISEYKPKNIFCHADLIHLSDEYKNLFKDINVYSGHIHTPQKEQNLITLGSTYALTFADCNADRGFYILDNQTDELLFVAAKNIIKFYRFYNDEIFNIDAEKLKNDYVEVYIDKINLLNETYTKRITEISANIHNISVIPNVEVKKIDNEKIEFKNYNIEEICKENIPEELMEKFNKLC